MTASSHQEPSHKKLKSPRLIFYTSLSLAVASLLTVIDIFLAVHLSQYVEKQILERYQTEQMVSVFHQAARLSDTLENITKDLENLSRRKELINLEEKAARALLRHFFDSHASFVVAGYRMDNTGVLKYVEGKDRKGEGFDISKQAHVKALFKTGSNVISGSFMAVEGYSAIAIHVPVFKEGTLDGSLATLVRWDGFKGWFTMANDKTDCFTVLLDKDRKVIWHPDSDFIGKAIETLPGITAKEQPLDISTLYQQHTATLSGPFFGQKQYVVACQPFSFEGVTYTMLHCAPYEGILMPIHRATILTVLLTGGALVIVLISLGFFLYGFHRERKNLLLQEEVTKESSVRKKVEHDLTQTQDTFLTVLNSIDATVYVADIEDHTILFMNQYMEKSFDNVKWNGRKCYKIFRGKDKPCRRCTNPKLLDETGRPTGVHVWEARNPVTGKWYHNFDRAIKWIDGKMVRIQIATDITSLKEYEAQQRELSEKLQRAQKMEAIGTLAGGVAHDLNNVLSGIVTYPELMLMDLEPDSPLVEPLKAIQQSGLKASEIVNDLLTLGRRGVTVSNFVNLNEIISEYLHSPEYEKLITYHPEIRIQSDTAPDLFDIMGSPIHLRKTVMNLVSNAVEAHMENGKVTIRTFNTYLDQPLKGYEEVSEGDYVVLTVSDQGIGISEEDQKRVFEPFYTKKVMGRSGTGLGMAVVWGTVQDHCGYICIDSEESSGTQISVYFPATRETEELKTDLLPLENYTGNKESILVVDDIPEQRQIAKIILKKLNYSVTTAPSGEKAIDYMKTKSYDLLLLDMIMDPGIDGLDTYKAALELNPVQRAVLASGFSETERVREAQALGAGMYVKKPYQLKELGKAVSLALGNSNPQHQDII